jgi:hypothetical protein
MKIVNCKYTGLSFKVKRIRKSGKVELEQGAVIPHEEFKLNWIVIE